MMLRSKPLSATAFLTLVMNIFRSHALTCHPAEYQKGDECCPMCPAGRRVKLDCTELKSTSCQLCTVGTFMNRPTGLGQCFACSNCDTGSGLKIKTACTTTSDTVCEPLEGFYCIDSNEDACLAAQKHSRCRPGQYISQKGTSRADTVCEPCQPGYYSQDGVSCAAWTVCSERQVKVKEGSPSSDIVCGSASRIYFCYIPVLLLTLTIVGLVIGGRLTSR